MAVNVARTGPEGDLRPRENLPWSSLRPDFLREDFLRSVYGREIRSGVLAAVILLLLLESFLSRPRRAAGGFEAGRRARRPEGVSA